MEYVYVVNREVWAAFEKDERDRYVEFFGSEAAFTPTAMLTYDSKTGKWKGCQSFSVESFAD